MTKTNGSNGNGLVLFSAGQKVRFTTKALKSDCCVGEAKRTYLVESVSGAGGKTPSYNGNHHPQRVCLQKVCMEKVDEGDCAQSNSRVCVSGNLLQLAPVRAKKKTTT